MLALMIKTANRAKKERADSKGDLAVLLFELFRRMAINDKAKKLINHETQRRAELEKQEAIDSEIADNRKGGKWFYLASSHKDCAKDHLPYQGKLYVDEKAPKEAIEYAKSRGLYTVQWVMGEPAWFITRPNCRHYFVALTLNQAQKPLKKLRRRWKTHTKEGDRAYSTPKTRAIEEYRDRLRLYRALYREFPTQKLKNEILKTELLLKKWINS